MPEAKRYILQIYVYIESDGGGAGGRQTWLAVAVANGTLVADVVAADTVAGVAPCIMGTWRKRSHRQSNQIIPPPQKNDFVYLFIFFNTCLSTGCWQTQESDPFSSSLYSPTAPPIRIMKQQQMRRRHDNRHWGNLWSAVELIGKSEEQSVITRGSLLPHPFSSALQAHPGISSRVYKACASETL